MSGRQQLQQQQNGLDREVETYRQFKSLIEEAKLLLRQAQEGVVNMNKLKALADRGLTLLVGDDNSLEIAVLDMHLLEVLFKIYGSNLRTLCPDRFRFDANAFDQKLRLFCGGVTVSPKIFHKNLLKNFAPHVNKILCGSLPNISSSMVLEVEQATQKIVKQREKRVKDKIEPVKNPEKVASVEGKTLEHTVMAIENILTEAYTENKKQPLNYLKFVIHPTSFSITVENIFHIAFLINNNKAAINVDPNTNMPIIAPVRQAGALTREGNSAMAICITMDEWKELVNVLNIKQPLIVLPGHKRPAVGQKRK